MMAVVMRECDFYTLPEDDVRLVLQFVSESLEHRTDHTTAFALLRVLEC